MIYPPVVAKAEIEESHDDALDAVRQRGLTKIDQIIRAVVEVYKRLYDQDAYNINCGSCEMFAEDVIYVITGGNEETEELYAVWRKRRHPARSSHCFIVFRGRFYDSQCPKGVDHWKKLPAFG